MDCRLEPAYPRKVHVLDSKLSDALLTKALCVVYPDRFMTIVSYDQKRIMAKTVYDLGLPDADRVGPAGRDRVACIAIDYRRKNGVRRVVGKSQLWRDGPGYG